MPTTNLDTTGVGTGPPWHPLATVAHAAATPVTPPTKTPEAATPTAEEIAEDTQAPAGD
jgi:hypothetical protein